jgi:hypothetical protein
MGTFLKNQVRLGRGTSDSRFSFSGSEVFSNCFSSSRSLPCSPKGPLTIPPTTLRLGGLDGASSTFFEGYLGRLKAKPEPSAVEWSMEPLAEWGALLELEEMERGFGRERQRSFMRRSSMSWQRGTMCSRDWDQMMRVRSSRCG